MKNKRFLVLFLCLLVCVCPLTVHAAPGDPDSGEVDTLPSATLTLEGDGGSISAGQTFSLLLTVSGSGWVGIEATLHYDPQLLTVSEAVCLPEGWSSYSTDEKLILTSDTTLDPLSGKTDVCRLYLRVSDEAESGSEVSLRLDSFKLTDGKSNYAPATPTFTKKIAPADSSAARLKSLDAGIFQLTPDFDPDVFNYTVTGVPATMTSFDLAFVPKTDDLTVTRGGDSQLHGGRNTMTLTVDAPNGASVTYTVIVIRDFDGDYVPSDDSALRELTLTAGTLSPAFDPIVHDYLVTLPNEAAGSIFTAGGNPRSEGALNVAAATVLLEEGNTELTVVCTAENGETSEYHLTVCVMPPYEGIAPYVAGDAAQTLTPVITEKDGALTVSSPYAHPEATYYVVWTVDGKTVDEGRSLKITDELRGKTVVATITGTDGFTGESSAEYALPAAGSLRQIPLNEKTILFGALALALILALGILIGIPAGRAAAKRKLRAQGYSVAPAAEGKTAPAPADEPEPLSVSMLPCKEESELVLPPMEKSEEPELVLPVKTDSEEELEPDVVEALLMQQMLSSDESEEMTEEERETVEELAPLDEDDELPQALWEDESAAMPVIPEPQEVVPDPMADSSADLDVEEAQPSTQEIVVIYDDGSDEDSRVVRFDDDGNGFTNVEQ